LLQLRELQTARHQSRRFTLRQCRAHNRLETSKSGEPADMQGFVTPRPLQPGSTQCQQSPDAIAARTVNQRRPARGPSQELIQRRHSFLREVRLIFDGQWAVLELQALERVLLVITPILLSSAQVDDTTHASSDDLLQIGLLGLASRVETLAGFNCSMQGVHD
jgi:hypothetical protein